MDLVHFDGHSVAKKTLVEAVVFAMISNLVVIFVRNVGELRSRKFVPSILVEMNALNLVHYQVRMDSLPLWAMK